MQAYCATNAWVVCMGGADVTSALCISLRTCPNILCKTVFALQKVFLADVLGNVQEARYVCARIVIPQMEHSWNNSLLLPNSVFRCKSVWLAWAIAIHYLTPCFMIVFLLTHKWASCEHVWSTQPLSRKGEQQNRHNLACPLSNKPPTSTHGGTSKGYFGADF